MLALIERHCYCLKQFDLNLFLSNDSSTVEEKLIQYGHEIHVCLINEILVCSS